MGAGEQILLCHSLESGPFTEYLDKVKQQDEQQQTHSLHHLQVAQKQVIENATKTLGSATTQLHESIKCVLNWTNVSPAAGDIDGPSISGGGGATPAIRPSNRTARQLLKAHQHSSSYPERNHNLVTGLLTTGSLEEHSHALCRLKETLNNYYLEHCIHSQEIATLPVTAAGLNISGIAFTDTILAAAAAAINTTAAVTPELGGLSGNDSIMDDSLNQPPHAEPTYHWRFLFLVIIFIIAGGLGNILVCLAIALDRKLQNVTNYFLLSLAIADLLVSLFVMPLGAIPTFLGGYWPLGEHWCNVYVTCDVLACSASIWHMCFISLGRYLGIKNPLGSRHRATKRIVGIKIAVCWLMAMPVSSSIAILGSIDMQNIIPEQNVCTINNKTFFVYGSLVAFYIPMVIMVSTYALTVQLLRKKARFAAAHPESEIFRSLMSHRLGGTNRYAKHSTGGYGGSAADVDHVEATNLKQPPPYLKSKVKSMSETELVKSRRQQVEKNDFGQNHQAHTPNQASTLAWNCLLPSTSDTHTAPLNDTHQAEEYTKLVRENPHRNKQAAITRNKNNDKGIGPPGHKTRGVCSSITGISSAVESNNSVPQKKVFASTCDQATQTSPRPLKRTTDMRGHKLKLNIQSVASPYLNFNLRLPKNRKRPSLSANAVANEQKATKVLGIVFFTFVLCWSPFFILNIVMVLYPRENIPDHVIDVCLWLGYVSSTINPIIYTIFNRTFRAAFIRLLRCNCQRSGRPYRYRSVTETKGAASLCARSALPLAISLQGTGFFGSSQTNVRNASTTVTDSEC